MVRVQRFPDLVWVEMVEIALSEAILVEWLVLRLVPLKHQAILSIHSPLLQMKLHMVRV